jgi:hypothetical protein
MIRSHEPQKKLPRRHEGHEGFTKKKPISDFFVNPSCSLCLRGAHLHFERELSIRAPDSIVSARTREPVTQLVE